MLRRIFFVLCCCIVALTAKGQASWEKFGQNRVQYRTFEWKYFDSTHFRTFYYDYGKTNAMYALNLAEQELSHIVYMMGGRLNKKLNLILYNSFSDYRQTNLGRKNDELNAANGGKVDVATDNVPIYFNGDHNHLKKQIRSGIAKVIKDNMLFGDNIKDVVKNAVQMNLPDWYTLGYVSFIADEWNGEQQANLQSLLQQSHHPNFTDMATTNPTLVGHSFWHFISERYGENYISNLLYLTRYRKSVSNAIEIVFKKPSSVVFTEWETFYSTPISTSVDSLDSLAGRITYSIVKPKREAEYSRFVASPSGREIAYVEKKDGAFKVYIQDVLYKKTYLIIDGGTRGLADLADPDYPMICWSPSGKKLAALYQKKNALNLRIFTTGKRIMENRVIPPRKIERITGMCFMGDENALAITGIKKGQSDLFRLTIQNNKIDAITNDLFDDKDPHFVQNGTSFGILFLSNRNNRFIENSKSDHFNSTFNVFLYEPQKGTILTPLSNTDGSLHSPIQWGLEQYSYLEDMNGKLNRKIVSIEKNGTSPDTFSNKNASPTPFMILDQDYLQTNANVVEVTHQKKNFVIFKTPHSVLKERDDQYDEVQKKLKDSLSVSSISQLPVVPSEYITPFENTTDSTGFLDQIFSNTQKKSSRYQSFVSASNMAKAKQYKMTFNPDFIQSTLDNTLLFTRYQPISSQFNNVGLSGFLTSTLTDVMEDYKITGGARLGIDLKSLDYFLQFANFRRRIDWGLLYFHTSSTDQMIAPAPYYSPYLVVGKKGLDFLQSNFTYPFNMLKSLRFQLGVRYDRTRYLAKEKYSIEIPTSKEYWLVGRGEYVYDNTINPMLNIWKGSRAKVFIEYQYKFNGQTKGFTNFGYDARNYKTLYKNMILASRFAGAHSFGNAKILYYLGGVDNPIISKFDNNTVVNIDQSYAFQTLATNLRGFKQGARNGNSYMVINEEIRLPIYNTFFKRPIKSGFIRNLQAVAFADAGITMKGIFPSADNIINQIKIQDNQSNVAVYFERSGALGYGLGLRSRFLGYFVRTDFAWNLGGGSKPMLHLSLATDF